ncbi:MAG: class C sortase [Lachnospiraceae bacterium]
MKVVRGLLLVVGFIVGLGIFAYPTISNWLAVHNHIQAIQSYEKYVTGLSQEQIEEEWVKARKYNDLLQDGTVTDPFSDVDYVEPFTEYDQTLNINGIMGYIEIPAINADIPIYHGVSEEVLMKGVGHIKSTALPVGGVSTHCVLPAHSGLPEVRLFNDLEKLQEGDYFFIYVINETLAYQVDQISVVEPDDISLLQPADGKDYVTLLTCTPISINSHRLLVRGERCEMPEPRPVGNSRSWDIDWIFVLIIVVILLLLIHIYRKHHRTKGQLPKR